MKIKRYFAQDIRQAMRMVRNEQGPDAVILSNNKVDGGVEIVAATDFDEAMYSEWTRGEVARQGNESKTEKNAHNTEEKQKQETRHGLGLEATLKSLVEKTEHVDDSIVMEMQQELKTIRTLLESRLSELIWADLIKHNPVKTELLKRLFRLGISEKISYEIVAGANTENNDIEKLWRKILITLGHRIAIDESDAILTKGGVIALVGPTGVGKTTTIAKLATRYVLRNGSRGLGLITMDNYRIGAHDQLRNYAKILDVPVTTAGNVSELKIALEGYNDKSLVLIDTAGMSQRDVRVHEQYTILKEAGKNILTYLVMSSTTHYSGIVDIISAYEKANAVGCIVTKIDETTNLGSIISALIQHHLPLVYVSNGQRVPEDIRIARRNEIINQAIAKANQNNIDSAGSEKTIMLGNENENVYF